jgi:Domain of unknown function (DUF4157)
LKTHAPKQPTPQQNASLHRGRLTPHSTETQAAHASPARGDEGRKAANGPPDPARFAHDFSRVPAHAKAAVRLRAKLEVNTPGDAYEQEADSVAEQVTRAPEPRLQRACACGGRCAGACGAEEQGRKHGLLQTKALRAGGGVETAAPPVVHEVLRSPGRPLDSSMRAFMESRFGQDFGRVRVHTDARAAESARALNALAYASGTHVVFGAGRYAPGAGEGRRLIAHELAHVVQQTGQQGGAAPRVQRQAKPGAATTEQKEGQSSSLSLEGVATELLKRLNRMVKALLARGINSTGISGTRTKQQAHIASTAYHIHTRDAVPLKDLQALKDGKDLDGNVWYKKQWERAPAFLSFLYDSRPATGEEIMAEAKKNALELVKRESPKFISTSYKVFHNVTCAYEGYEAGDPHRKPNVDEVPLSSHLSGNAVDINGIEWEKLGGPWSAEAKEFVAGFGLARPFTPESGTYCSAEPWHFELAASAPKSDAPQQSGNPTGADPTGVSRPHK